MAMKTFGGNRKTSDIIKAAKKQKLNVFTADYEGGGDHISFNWKRNDETIRVVYNTFNGRFFGQDFDSNDASLDNEPWFASLLDFVYLPAKTEAA